MSEQPDLSTLPKRMRYALEIQREATARLPYGYSPEYNFAPHNMWVAWADQWEAEDLAKAERGAAVDELADCLSAAFVGWMGDMTTTICHQTAMGLIESGWVKQ